MIGTVLYVCIPKRTESKMRSHEVRMYVAYRRQVVVQVGNIERAGVKMKSDTIPDSNSLLGAHYGTHLIVLCGGISDEYGTRHEENR